MYTVITMPATQQPLAGVNTAPVTRAQKNSSKRGRNHHQEGGGQFRVPVGTFPVCPVAPFPHVSNGAKKQAFLFCFGCFPAFPGSTVNASYRTSRTGERGPYPRSSGAVVLAFGCCAKVARKMCNRYVQHTLLSYTVKHDNDKPARWKRPTPNRVIAQIRHALRLCITFSRLGLQVFNVGTKIVRKRE